MNHEIFEYRNYRCRKCHKILSIRKDFSLFSTQAQGAILSNKKHDCCEGIEEGEKVLLDWVSVSHQPLKDAIEIIDENNNVTRRNES